MTWNQNLTRWMRRSGGGSVRSMWGKNSLPLYEIIDNIKGKKQWYPTTLMESLPILETMQPGFYFVMTCGHLVRDNKPTRGKTLLSKWAVTKRVCPSCKTVPTGQGVLF